jgi:hypothetical protein
MQHLDGLHPERFDAVEDTLAGPEQDSGDVERELVDDPGDDFDRGRAEARLTAESGGLMMAASASPGWDRAPRSLERWRVCRS